MSRCSVFSRYVVCDKNSGYLASLMVRRIDRRILDAAASRQGLGRVVDEWKKDYRYPSSLFAEIKVPAAISRLLLIAS